MPKDNLLFKLDNLEYQFHYLNGDLDSFRPRLGSTTKLYSAKGKKTSKRVAKLLSELEPARITEQLNALRLEIFNNKLYHLEKNLRSILLKQINQYKPKKSAKTDFTQVIENLEAKYGLEKFVELVCKSKIIKLAIAKILPSKNAVPPKWFENHEFWAVHNDKAHEFNPRRIWTEVLLQNKKSDQLVSTLMNNEKSKQLLSSFDSGMNVFLGIKKEAKSKTFNEESQDDERIESKQDSKSKVPSKESQDATDEGEVPELDDDVLKQYDNLLADSEEENEESEAPTLDPNVNYNEVTDEEPDQESGEDEELESDENSELYSKTHKTKLPELMAGYYSGGDSSDESDVGDDKVAREQLSLKEKKKNRRGQRARRKIWEKKYGREAKHVQREVEKEHEDRKRRQTEYEERVAKRAAKSAAREVEEATRIDQRFIKPVEKKAPQAEHPSWVAKKEAEEKQKNAKFQGKKITFD